MSQYRIVIPSRLKSTRLPEKPLRKIGSWELINTVVISALATQAPVVVATDAPEIVQAVNEFKHKITQQYPQLLPTPDHLQVLLTSAQHQNGTERLAEVIELLNCADDELIVNIQGDEPFFNPALIQDLVADYLKAEQRNSRVVMGTIGQLAQAEEINNPNAVKAVITLQGQALYFSRAAIPHPHASQVGKSIDYIKHAGVYCYRAGFIRKYKTMPMTPLAEFESLEQLKVLEHGYQIQLLKIAGRGFIGIDTPEDLEQARQLMHSYWEQFATAARGDFPELNSYLNFLAQFGRGSKE